MSNPVVANLCPDFLKRDMLHIYRQISDLSAFTPHVITRKRENASEFPFPEKQLTVVRKPRTRALRRFWSRTLNRRPVQLYHGEVKTILYEILRTDAALLHVYFGNVAVQYLPLIKTCPRPVVVSFHGADVGVDDAGPSYRDLLLDALDHATLVLARSQALLDDLRALGCPAEKLHLHRTGVPLDQWPARDAAAPPAADGPWHLLQACRLIEKKGLFTTLDAFAEIVAEHPAATLTLAGDGPLRQGLEKHAATLGIADKVRFPGFCSQDRLRELVYACHLFLHPSQTGADGNREGVPNAMLEAMATAVPVLATRHGGIPEAIDHRTSGLLCDERDHRALAANALEVMASPGLYRTLASGARQAVTDHFERGRQTTALENLYRLAIENAATGSTVEGRPTTPPR